MDVMHHFKQIVLIYNWMQWMTLCCSCDSMSMNNGYGIWISNWVVVQLIRNRYHPIWMIQKCFPSFIPLIRIIKYLLFLQLKPYLMWHCQIVIYGKIHKYECMTLFPLIVIVPNIVTMSHSYSHYCSCTKAVINISRINCQKRLHTQCTS